MPVLFPLFVYDDPVHKRTDELGRQFSDVAVPFHRLHEVADAALLFLTLFKRRFQRLDLFRQPRYPQSGVTAQANSYSLQPVVASLGNATCLPLQKNRDAAP